jgi:hypothetical protein
MFSAELRPWKISFVNADSGTVDISDFTTPVIVVSHAPTIVQNPDDLTTSVELVNNDALVKVVDASSVAVGATLTKVSGAGAFFNASSVTVQSVNTAGAPHVMHVDEGNNGTPGHITFSVVNPNSNVNLWISNIAQLSAKRWRVTIEASSQFTGEVHVHVGEAFG